MFACVYAPDCLSEKLLALAASFSPLVEDTAPGTVIFSIVGLGRMIGGPLEIAAVVARRGAEAGIQGNLAISADPDTALLGARHIAGVTVIPPGKEADRLGGLPIEVLPAELELIETLHTWGVRTLAELAELPPLGFIARFGDEGERLLRLARGETRRSLRAMTPPESYERSAELDHPLRLLDPLLFVIASLINELMQGLSFNRVTLGLNLTSKSEHRCTLEFPVPVHDHKIVLKQLRFDLEAHPPKSAIVAVRVHLNPVAPRVLQHGLFLPQAPAPEKLQLTLARLTALMGEGNVGSPELLDTHRPDAFVMRPFNPEAAGNSAPAPPTTTIRFAFRYYRPPLPAQVRLQSERPVFVNAQKVLIAAGPWRASGDWWTDTAWNREDWDVELGNGGLYRVYSTLYSSHARWFLEGVYD
jgi:protein ImuB